MTDTGRDLVKNAADGEQVQHAARKEKDRARRDVDDVRAVLSSRQGRRFVWRVLKAAGLYRSITVEGSMIYALSGRRDFGLEVLDWVTGASRELYVQMESEGRADQARDRQENVAARTPPAEK
ncbi:MAG TPA: hypothetical protein VN628_00495 [Vicinamibacterales bacterium]|nr:hypothetical protein [Vicinamibacterales bacterium]